MRNLLSVNKSEFHSPDSNAVVRHNVNTVREKFLACYIFLVSVFVCFGSLSRLESQAVCYFFRHACTSGRTVVSPNRGSCRHPHG